MAAVVALLVMGAPSNHRFYPRAMPPARPVNKPAGQSEPSSRLTALPFPGALSAPASLHGHIAGRSKKFFSGGRHNDYAIVRSMQPPPSPACGADGGVMQKTYLDFLKKAAIVVAVAVLPFLVWYLFGVVLITIGAIIFAMLVRLGAQPFTRWLSVPEPVALVISGLVIVLIIGGTGYLFGSRIGGEFQDIVRRVDSASSDILQNSPLGKFVLDHAAGLDLSVTDVLSGFLKISSSVLEAVVIMVISGAYLAAQPDLYRNGLIWLFPPGSHARAAGVAALAGRPVD
jgi:hypothetical protein